MRRMLAVVYFPQTNLDTVNLLREKYDANWKMIPPHITIVSPITELTQDQLVQQVEDMAINFKPFPINLTGLTKTSDGCLFLMVEEGSKEIITIHDGLYSGILAPYLPTAYKFAPHITLGDFARTNEELLAEALSEAESLDLDLTCIFNALTVIEGDGKAPAKTVKVIDLPLVDKTVV